MSKKSGVAFLCRECGHRAPKWMGRCPDCGEWDALVETVVGRAGSAAAGRAAGAGTGIGVGTLAAVESSAADRIRSGIAELDRVLGGGFVPGSALLLGGDPGIGKSTIVLQACDRVARQGVRCLYVTGEESLQQVRLRADRLGLDPGGIHAVATTELAATLQAIETTAPALVVIDSVQTIADPEIASVAGSLSQIRSVAGALCAVAKRQGAAILLIGHVTKEGHLAGPRVLEHLVDAVLMFEGDRFQGTRILRAVKNRFGAVSEVGVFELREDGLAGVSDASAHFLAEAPDGPVEGSVVFPAVEGSRVILVEIQALTGKSALSFPIRRTSGIDPERLPLILAVLEVRVGLPVSTHDVFVNVVGGISVEEPAAELAVALAIASSVTGRMVPHRLAVFGEVGLRGEVRRVSAAGLRAATLRLADIDDVVGPKGNADDVCRDSPATSYSGVPDVATSLAALTAPSVGPTHSRTAPVTTTGRETP